MTSMGADFLSLWVSLFFHWMTVALKDRLIGYDFDVEGFFIGWGFFVYEVHFMVF